MDSSFCSKCGAKKKKGQVACSKCHQAFGVSSPPAGRRAVDHRLNCFRCGKEQIRGNSFCPECGQDLGKLLTGSSVVPEPRLPSSFSPKRLKPPPATDNQRTSMAADFSQILADKIHYQQLMAQREIQMRDMAVNMDDYEQQEILADSLRAMLDQVTQDMEALRKDVTSAKTVVELGGRVNPDLLKKHQQGFEDEGQYSLKTQLIMEKMEAQQALYASMYELEAVKKDERQLLEEMGTLRNELRRARLTLREMQQHVPPAVVQQDERNDSFAQELNCHMRLQSQLLAQVQSLTATARFYDLTDITAQAARPLVAPDDELHWLHLAPSVPRGGLLSDEALDSFERSTSPLRAAPGVAALAGIAATMHDPHLARMLRAMDHDAHGPPALRHSPSPAFTPLGQPRRSPPHARDVLTPQPPKRNKFSFWRGRDKPSELDDSTGSGMSDPRLNVTMPAMPAEDDDGDPGPALARGGPAPALNRSGSESRLQNGHGENGGSNGRKPSPPGKANGHKQTSSIGGGLGASAPLARTSSDKGGGGGSFGPLARTSSDKGRPALAPVPGRAVPPTAANLARLSLPPGVTAAPRTASGSPSRPVSVFGVPGSPATSPSLARAPSDLSGWRPPEGKGEPRSAGRVPDVKAGLVREGAPMRRVGERRGKEAAV